MLPSYPEIVLMNRKEAIELIKLIGLDSKIVTESNWKECCTWAVNKINHSIPCTLILRREFHD